MKHALKNTNFLFLIRFWFGENGEWAGAANRIPLLFKIDGKLLFCRSICEYIRNAY